MSYFVSFMGLKEYNLEEKQWKKTQSQGSNPTAF
jgi:hypothetical protein